jgi:hypothetical protein
VLYHDYRTLLLDRPRLLQLALKLAALYVYVRHFLPIVRYLRTKMLRHLCGLWMIFEQEENLRTAYRFSFQQKVKQVLTQEIPITIKLIVFMWVLRKFVSIGAKSLLNLGILIHERYIGAKEMRYVGD